MPPSSYRTHRICVPFFNKRMTVRFFHESHHYVWSFRKMNPDNFPYCRSILYHNGELPSGNAYNPFTGWNNLAPHDGGWRGVYVGTPWYFEWCWDGQMSILRMYNGKALTANEVKRNYNADAAKFGLTPI